MNTARLALAHAPLMKEESDERGKRDTIESYNNPSYLVITREKKIVWHFLDNVSTKSISNVCLLN